MIDGVWSAIIGFVVGSNRVGKFSFLQRGIVNEIFFIFIFSLFLVQQSTSFHKSLFICLLFKYVERVGSQRPLEFFWQCCPLSSTRFRNRGREVHG